MFEKWISILLIPLLFLQTLVPAMFGNRNEHSMGDADFKTLHSLSEYVTYVDDHGAPVRFRKTKTAISTPKSTTR